MSDLKAAFRAAKEQKGGGKAPTAAQIRALKVAKLQQKQAPVPASGGAASTAAAASSPAAHRSQNAATGTAAQGKAAIPQDFFQAPSKASAPAAAAAQQRPIATTPPTAAPARGQPSVAAAAGPAAPVPEGFFADKAADAKARGVKLPDAKDVENDFQAFQRSIEEDLKQAAAEEAQEAEEDAADKEDRDGFAQWVLMQRVDELRKRKRADGEVTDAATVTAEMLGLLPSNSLQGGNEEEQQQQMAVDVGTEAGPSTQGTQPSITLPKRRKLQDTLAALAASGSDEDSDADEGGSADGLVDWRRKGV